LHITFKGTFLYWVVYKLGHWPVWVEKVLPVMLPVTSPIATGVWANRYK